MEYKKTKTRQKMDLLMAVEKIVDLARENR